MVAVPLSAAVTQREVGTDVPSFGHGVRDAQRQSVDLLLVGDIRDRDTARAVLAAAQAGQLVVVTMAAVTSEAAIHRLIGMFEPAEQQQVRAQLASALRAVIAQQLVPAADGGKPQLVCEVLLATDAIRTLLREGRTHEVAATLENQVRAGMTSMDRSLAYYVAAGRLLEADARAVCLHPDRFSDHLLRAPGARSDLSTGAGGAAASTGAGARS